MTLSAVAYAQEVGPPITGVSVSNVTQNGATVTAMINPEGGETEYDVELTWKEKCSKKPCKEKTGNRTTGRETLAAVNKRERVSVHVTKLTANTRYLVDLRSHRPMGSTRVEDEKGLYKVTPDSRVPTTTGCHVPASRQPLILAAAFASSLVRLTCR